MKRKGEPMPDKFSALATYNAERGRGIMHTPEWDAKMAELQREWDAREVARWHLMGFPT